MCLYGVKRILMPSAAIRYKVALRDGDGYKSLHFPHGGLQPSAGIGCGWAMPEMCNYAFVWSDEPTYLWYACGVHCFVEREDAEFVAGYEYGDAVLLKVECRGPIVSGWEIYNNRSIFVDVWAEARVVEELDIPRPW